MVPSARTVTGSGDGAPLPPGEFTSAGLRACAGQSAEVEVYGTKVSGRVVRSGDGFVVVEGPRIGDLRRLRLGVRATVTLGTVGGAARIEATLGSARDGIVLQFCGPVLMVNRRAHPRAPLTVKGEMVWLPLQGSVAVTSAFTTLDVSAGGIRLEIEAGGQTPAEDAVALLALRFVPRRMILPARVLDANSAVVRVQFCGPDPDDVARIGTMVLQDLMQEHGARP